MHVNALKIIRRNCRRTVLPTLLWMVLFVPGAWGAASSPVKGSWDQWLDSAYQLTWHDQQNIGKWIAENEVNVFDKKLVDFAHEWELRIHAVPQDEKLRIYPDSAYRQLAIAQMLLYLSTKDVAYLKKAAAIMNSENLKAKIELPEIAFWYYYIRAHYYMERGEADKFVRDVYHLWLDVILKLEAATYELRPSTAINTLHGFYRSMPYLYRNMANLILQRAIVKRKMDHIDGLGVIIWSLSSRMPPKGYGQWVDQVAKRISNAESDNFRLAYIVQLMEAEKKRFKVENLFDSGGDKAQIEQSLTDSLAQYEMLYGLAKTLHGRATALTKQLQLTSFVLSRLYEKGPHQALLATLAVLQRKEGQAWHEPKATLEQAIQIFDDLADSGSRPDELMKNGFLSSQAYIATSHELWRAIMNLCLDTAIYYERQIDPQNAKSMRVNIPLLERSLTHYLDFFARYVNQGYRNIVPDNAFYGAVEASELLSQIYFLSAPWERGMEKYEMALARSLEALEIFPFDIKNYFLVARRLSELGRLERYNQYVSMLAYRLRTSKLIRASVVQKSSYMGHDLLRLQEVLPQVLARAPSQIILQPGLQQVPQALSSRLTRIKKALDADTQNSQGNAQIRARIVELANQLTPRQTPQKAFTSGEIMTLLQDMGPLLAALDEYNKDAAHVSGTQPPEDEKPFIGEALIPSDLKQVALELVQIKEEARLLQRLPDLSKLRDTLVFEVNHPFHTLLRRFYHENAHQDLNYLRLLKGKAPLFPRAEQ